MKLIKLVKLKACSGLTINVITDGTHKLRCKKGSIPYSQEQKGIRRAYILLFTLSTITYVVSTYFFIDLHRAFEYRNMKNLTGKELHIRQCIKGLRGFVLDKSTAAPVANASLIVEGINHTIYSAEDGDYWRLLIPGTYNIKAAAPGWVVFIPRNCFSHVTYLCIQLYRANMMFYITSRPWLSCVNTWTSFYHMTT